MKFIITAQPGPDSTVPAPDAPFDEALFTAYMKFNEDMHQAGVLVAAEGLNPAFKTARVVAKGGRRTVVDGPFAESKELIGGFYIVEVDSLDEAIAWALKCPTGLGFDDVLEIRALTGEADLPPELVELIERPRPTGAESFTRKEGPVAARAAARCVEGGLKTAPLHRSEDLRYFFTHFCRQPPDGLASQPPVSPANTLPRSSAPMPSGRVPWT